MTQEFQTQPGFNPDFHFPPGTTVDFACRVVTGSCYSFEAGEEMRCRRCGSRDTKVISPPADRIRCDDGPVAIDAGITKCHACEWAYVWRICGD